MSVFFSFLLILVIITAITDTTTAQDEDPCDPDTCNGHGTCSDGTCSCDDGWLGTDCDIEVFDKCDCSGHGWCRRHDGAIRCQCVPAFTGTKCESRRFKEINIEPVKSTYNVGNVVTCFADDIHTLSFLWLNQRTNVFVRSNKFTVDATFVGLTTPMTCQAEYIVNEHGYVEHFFVDITVPAEEMTKQNMLSKLLNDKQEALKKWKLTEDTESRQEMEQIIIAMDAEIAKVKREIESIKARNARLEVENRKAEEMAKENELNKIINEKEKALAKYKETEDIESRQKFEQYFIAIDVEIANRRLELDRMKASNARLEAENLKAEELAAENVLSSLITNRKGALRFLDREAKDDKMRQEVKRDIEVMDAEIAKVKREIESIKARSARLEKELMKSG